MNSNNAQTSKTTKFNADAYLEMVAHGLTGTEASARDKVFQHDSDALNMAKLSGLIDGMAIRAIVLHVEPQDPYIKHQFPGAQSCKEQIAKNYEAIKNGERQY